MSSSRKQMIAVASFMALASAGCAQNAILELYVEVPPINTMVDGRRLGAVRINVAGGLMNPVAPTVQTRIYGLDGTQSVVGIAIDRRDANVETLSVDVAYCENDELVDTCGTVRGVEHLTIRNPFYTGANTCYFRDLPPGPFAYAAPQTVSECEVGGCLAASLENTNFCGVEGMPATHNCRRSPGTGGYCDTLRDSLSPRQLRN